MPTPTTDTSWRTAPRRGLVTGVSRVIPLLTAGGVVLAAGYTLGGRDPVGGTIAWHLVTVGRAVVTGGPGGVALVVPVLGGFVGQAIGDRPGFAPGFLLAYVMALPAVVAHAAAAVGVDSGGATPGVLGALAAGLLAGHLARWIGDLALPAAVAPATPILLAPALATLAALPVGVAVAVPLALVTEAAATVAAVSVLAAPLGVLVGAMMAFDLGGPVNKVAYVFAIALLVEGVVEPMAAVMVAGMTPPLGAALAIWLRPGRYPEDLVDDVPRVIGRAMLFITEGAIPFTEDGGVPARAAVVLGSAVAGGVAMVLGVGSFVPHGGVLVAPLSTDPVAFLGCVALGGCVTAGVATAGRAVAGPPVPEVSSE